MVNVLCGAVSGRSLGSRGCVVGTTKQGLPGVVSQALPSRTDDETVLALRLVSRQIKRYQEAAQQACDMRDWFGMAAMSGCLVRCIQERDKLVASLRPCPF